MITLYFFYCFCRFGLSTNASVDEEAKKKKARLERFSQGSKVDPSEEEKKRAREIRSVFNFFYYTCLK